MYILTNNYVIGAFPGQGLYFLECPRTSPFWMTSITHLRHVDFLFNFPTAILISATGSRWLDCPVIISYFPADSVHRVNIVKAVCPHFSLKTFKSAVSLCLSLRRGKIVLDSSPCYCKMEILQHAYHLIRRVHKTKVTLWTLSKAYRLCVDTSNSGLSP